MSTALRAPARPQTAVRSALPTLGVVSVAVVWGVTFTVVDSATLQLPPADLVLWRFGLGTAILLCLGRSKQPLPRQLRNRGVVLGALLGIGFLLQAWALTFIDAMTSGFLTSLLVVIAPLAGWAMFRDRLGPRIWLAVGIATVGVLVLSARVNGFGAGEALTILAAVLWGIHVVLLSRWSQAEHTLALARLQTGTVTALALATVVGLAVCTGGSVLPSAPADVATWLRVSFLAAVSTAAAMVVLTWSQARIGSARTAIILTLEPAFAGVTGVAMGAVLTGRILIGAALLICAMLVAELAGRPSAAGDSEPPVGSIWSSGAHRPEPKGLIARAHRRRLDSRRSLRTRGVPGRL